MEHILVTYSQECAENGHVDPNFTQLVYGNSGANGQIFKKHITPGSYVFFNARIGNQRYITAYFYVEKILLKGMHSNEIEMLNCSAKEDVVIIIGSRTFSKILTSPIVLDKELMIKLKSYGANSGYFQDKAAEGYSELEAISHKTLNPKVIPEEEKELLIGLCKNRG